MHHTVRDDRLWFHEHPAAVVRFRASTQGEFDPLTEHGETPPVFRPSGSQAGDPLTWVAVIDLMQLLGTNSELPNDPGVRIRLQTPAIPFAEHQRAAKQELMEAVAAELLVQAKGTDTRAQHNQKEQNGGHETPDVIAA
jgi:hypothetical protein